jgi:hypothetical protein
VILESAFCVVDIDEGPAPEGGWPAARSPRETPGQETAPETDGATPPAEDPNGETHPPAEAPVVVEW